MFSPSLPKNCKSGVFSRKRTTPAPSVQLMGDRERVVPPRRPCGVGRQRAAQLQRPLTCVGHERGQQCPFRQSQETGPRCRIPLHSHFHLPRLSQRFRYPLARN
ncbi:hypothetical protein BaRGS_00015217 [Batillaria attramentaria]|uniref:Uncharacterized protein n=1 Tax=Batillaria attramentaria TaxID=370345 RepID=A0ABD0L2N5_9CAEN